MSKLTKFKDGLTSLVSGMGLSSHDKSATTSYSFIPLNYHQIETAYRTSWICRKAIDQRPKDMFRNWRDWQAEKDQITLIRNEERRLGLQVKSVEACIKGRLWGGAAIYFKTNQDISEPLDISRIKKGEIEYLTVMTRKDLTAEDIERDPSKPNYGKPTYYRIANSESSEKIHYSHFVIFYGNPYPDEQNTSSASSVGEFGSQGWSDSILQTISDTCKNAEATIANVASLVFESNVDVFSVPNFMDSLSDPEYETRILERFRLANTSKSINRALVMDAEEDFNRKQVNFSSLAEIIEKFLVIVSSAASTPHSKFMSQGAAGMNATGEGDMKNYHEDIKADQALIIEPAMKLFDDVLVISALGSRPENVEYHWSPLEQMSDKDIADIGKVTADTAKALNETGLYPPLALQRATTNKLVQIGAFAGLDNILEELKGDEAELDFNEPVQAE